MSKAWRKAPRNPLPSEDDVRAVQRALNEAGARPELAVDGRYGPQTRAAIKVYQANHGLLPDGVVGELTRAALDLG
jgi:peptidoglycan hydrolase-like protein with peptidoglycan-binding domain